jgi:NADPH:quinone reductase-like Zn-dependent oxidoreductase
MTPMSNTKPTTTMHAVFISQYGGSDVLRYGKLPRPVPKQGQVLVRVRAASVNPRDWIVREGRYVFKFALPAFPIILGSDISGEVVACGPTAARFKPGDAVFGMQPLRGGMGAYAEYVAIDEAALAAKPEALSHAEAAAVPCAGLTAWQAVAHIGRVERGATVTVCGASGGVGSYAVQFAKAFGAHVTAVTSGANADLALSLGADAVVDYKSEDFTRVVNRQNLVFDAVGRYSFARSLQVLAPAGRYVSTIPVLKRALESLSSQGLRLASFGHRPSAHLVLVRANGDDLARIADLMQKGWVRSVIDSCFPLSETHTALERSRTWRSRGKIVLEVA